MTRARLAFIPAAASTLASPPAGGAGGAPGKNALSSANPGSPGATGTTGAPGLSPETLSLP